MKKFVALILSSALTAAIAGTALADSTAAPSGSAAAKPAASVAAPSATAVTPAATAPSAAPAVTAPAAPAMTAVPEPKAAAKEQAVRIGYVDMSQVAAETDAGKAATATLKVKSQKLSTKIEAKQKQLEKQKAAIEAKLETMTSKERAAKAKEFQKKMEEYQKLVRASDLEMQEMQEQLTTDIYKTIKKAAGEYGKAHGYAAVLAKKDILYTSDSVETTDLTEAVSAQLNKKPETK
jgi:outer membrane protein